MPNMLMFMHHHLNLPVVNVVLYTSTAVLLRCPCFAQIVHLHTSVCGYDQ